MTSVRSQMKVKQHRAEFEAEEQRREQVRLRPLREAEEKFKSTAAELGQRERELASIDVFNAPSSEIERRCKPYQDDGAGRTVEQLRTLINDGFHGALLEFAKRGIELQASGVEKLGRVGRVNSQTCDLTASATWVMIYEYLEEVGALNRTDRLIKVEPTPEPESEPDPNAVDIESIPVSGTREAEAYAKRLVEEQFMSNVVGPLLNEWIDSLKAEPWNVVLSTDEWKRVVHKLERLFVEQNLPLVPKSFDTARRIFSKDGSLPPGLLLESEELCDRIEMTKFTNDREARLDFVRETHRIHGT